jgi:hypothetical protein
MVFSMGHGERESESPGAVHGFVLARRCPNRFVVWPFGNAATKAAREMKTKNRMIQKMFSVEGKLLRGFVNARILLTSLYMLARSTALVASTLPCRRIRI